MKKTIARIMAAAMVVTSVVAPVADANAASSIFNNMTSAEVYANFGDGAYVSPDYYLDGALLNGDIDDEDYIDLEFTASDALLTGTGVEMEEVSGSVLTADVYYAASSAQTTLTSSNAVTATTATSSYRTLSTTNSTDINDLIGIGTRTTTSKVTTAKGSEFKDVTIARNVLAGDWLTIDWTNGVRTITRNANYANNDELIRQITAGNIIFVRADVWVNGVNQGFVWVRCFNATTANADDDYWNGIVKLKADNNRYTPIRVHVDAVDGTIAGLNGLYVQIVNGTAVNVINNRVVGTNAIATSTLQSNKLVIQDVQPDDYALLKSDVAKGKRLLLDEVYLFRVADAWNNNSLAGAGDAVYDFLTLGESTDFDTISIGKVTDIRSRLFKEGKEKLVQAKNVKWIRNGAFRKSKQLKKAILSDDVSMKKINEKAFYDCKKLNTVKVKVKTLKQVGKNAFGGSTDKKGLKFNLKASNKTQYNKAVKLFKKSGVKKAKFRKI